MIRRLLRISGSLMVVAGLLLLIWSFVVWRWNDPFTSVYTRWQQHKLSTRYESWADSFRPVVLTPGLSPVREQRAVARTARRYRLAASEGTAIGRIKVPRLGLNMILVNGTDHDSLTKGPGRDERTYMPGEGQLIYIAGHRTTYLAPFAHIERLRRGDKVTLELPYATFVYTVTGHVIVPATDIARLESHGHEVVALQACHPRFFATQRYIVYARPVEVKPRTGRAYAFTQQGRAIAT